jgi:hypothetical protein
MRIEGKVLLRGQLIRPKNENDPNSQETVIMGWYLAPGKQIRWLSTDGTQEIVLYFYDHQKDK